MTLSLRAMLVAGLLVAAMTAHEARAGGFSFYYGPSYYSAGYYPAPVYSYPAYAPVTVYRPIIQPVYVAPVYRPIVRPVVPVVYGPSYSYPTRVRYKRREIETKVYTPYGTYETEVKYDRWGNIRDIDYDFDD